MTNYLDLIIEPTSIEAPALKIKGNFCMGRTSDFPITFSGTLNDTCLRLESFISHKTKAKIVENSVRLINSKSSGSFEATLITPNQKEQKLKRPNSAFVLPLFGNYYPFKANHIKLSIESEENTRVVVTFVLPHDQIAISKSITSEYGHFAQKDGKYLIPKYTFQSDDGKLEFEIIYRFRPFIALKSSTFPSIIMYTAALLAAGIPKLSGITSSNKSLLIDVPMTGNPELSLLSLLSALVILLRINSMINTGLATRSWMLVLKGVTATFISILIIDSFRHIGFIPFYDRSFFEPAYDLFLKFGTSWTIISIVISLVIYPYIVSKSERMTLISVFILLSIILCILAFLFLPTHPIAKILGV